MGSWLAVLAVAGLLSACATKVPPVAASPAELSKIHSIAVVRPPEPKTYRLSNLNHPAGSALSGFGPLGILVGSAVATADMSAKQNRLNQAFKDQRLTISSDLAAKTADELAKRGFAVRVYDGPWKEVNGEWKIEADELASTADAVLVMVPDTVGFIANPPYVNDYAPTIWAWARLLGSDRKQVVYQGFHAVGFKPASSSWKYLSSTGGFKDFDALMVDTEAAAESLGDAAQAIAVSIAEDLKR